MNGCGRQHRADEVELAQLPLHRVDAFARIVLAIAAALGAASFVLIGWVAIFYVDFGTATRGGIFNSHLVVLSLIFSLFRR